jgi:hypothetical protein
MLAGWRTDGNAHVAFYNHLRLPRDCPGPPDRGRNHFQGDPRENARMEQTIDLRNSAADIDQGGVTLHLTAWLGGLNAKQGGPRGGGGSDDASCAVTVELLDQGGKILGQGAIEPVDSSDRRKELGAEKGVATPGLVFRELHAKVPARTRSLRVGVTSEGTRSTDRACVDELRLVLEKKP